ncbi:MAG: hypothetical protein Q8891_00070 [Bacteroidota bacterium]|nr:hypothetical protein [Bacteroidota bacterium]
MEATILNTEYKYNDFNPFIGLFINKYPYYLKVNQTFFYTLTRLPSTEIERLIGSEIIFEYLKPGEPLNNGTHDLCKIQNGYFKKLNFDLNYIENNFNGISFSAVTKKEFYYKKHEIIPQHFCYNPRIKFYSNSTLISEIWINSLTDFYLAFLEEINIYRVNGCACVACLDSNADRIERNIDLRVEVKSIKNLKLSNKKLLKKIEDLYDDKNEQHQYGSIYNMSYPYSPNIDLIKEVNDLIKLAQN